VSAVEHLRGLLVLLVAGWMLLLGLPSSPEPLQSWREKVSEPLVWTQRPLRIAQQWSLYGVGPNKVRRLSVFADDELLYRSGERHHPGSAVLHPFLRYRRIRPMAVHLCMGRSHGNAPHLLRYLVQKVRVLRPGVAQVRLECTSSPWPGDAPRIRQRWTSSAPSWRLEGP